MADFPAPDLRSRLPDVVSHVDPAIRGALDWVGMDGIALPLRLDGDDGVAVQVMARVGAYVNLARDGDRGIHMSRLYRALDQHLALQAPTPATLRVLLRDFLDTHAPISTRARVRVRFELPVRRSALRSGLHGWRAYPVELDGELEADSLRSETVVQVEYSSTCPGSAALSRQLVQQGFERDFPAAAVDHGAVHAWLGSAAGISATPHAQRSVAQVRVRFAANAPGSTLALIDRIETALGTPVQSAVRRDDEQEFARLNGQHPMYCEDAARRIRAALEAAGDIDDYAIRAAHIESLHPHDAIAISVRGVPGGYVAVAD